MEESIAFKCRRNYSYFPPLLKSKHWLDILTYSSCIFVTVSLYVYLYFLKAAMDKDFHLRVVMWRERIGGLPILPPICAHKQTTFNIRISHLFFRRILQESVATKFSFPFSLEIENCDFFLHSPTSLFCSVGFIQQWKRTRNST